MSILDKASLIQIPSGYKNGKLYSVKPTPTFGSELVTNGDFDTDSDWNKGANWTISGGTANRTANATSNISQVISGISGKKIQVLFTVSNYGGSGGIGASANGNDYTQNVGNGTFTEQITPTSDNLYIRASYAFVGSIDNVSVKEITNIGDFDFSRASSGTRLNSEGLIEVASVVSTTELVTNGDFASSSNWNGVNANGVTISNGTLNYSETPNGTNITQSSVVEIGKKYKVTFTISNYVKGGILVVFGAGGTTQEVSSNGTFNLYGVASLNTTLYLQARGASGTTLSIDNVSVKEVFENDVPRLDYSDGSCASLLLEGQSTNLITYSEDFSDSSWTNSLITVTANATTSPDGTLNADKLLNGVGSSHIGKSLTVTNGVDYTLTTFVKKVDNDVFQQQIFNSGYTEKVYLYFTFSTETITITDTVTGTSYISSAFKDMGNGWYKITLTIEAFDTTLRIRNRIGSENTGADNASLYIWGAMLEQSSYATSYIKTTSASATRTADVCNNAGTSATFNSTEGVLFAEIAALANDLTNRGLALSDGTSSNACRIYYSNSSNNIRFFFNVGGNAQVIKSVNLTDITDYNKIAFSYKQDDFKIYINGVKVEEDTSGIVPSANTFSKLSFDRGYGGENFYGKCKQLIVFNEALSDSELTTLTTL
jgi:hypothetical protein